MDISEQCGYTIAQQAALFHSIKPLFSNKPLMVVANKTDVTPLSSLPESDTALLAEMVQAAAVASNGGILHCLCLKPLAYAKSPAMGSGTGLQSCLTKCHVSSVDFIRTAYLVGGQHKLQCFAALVQQASRPCQQLCEVAHYSALHTR